MNDDSSLTSERHPPNKGTLICPECGHESDIEGDWNVAVATDVWIYKCPVCETTLTRRPRSKHVLSA